LVGSAVNVKHAVYGEQCGEAGESIPVADITTIAKDFQIGLDAKVVDPIFQFFERRILFHGREICGMERVQLDALSVADTGACVPIFDYSPYVIRR